MTTTFPSLRTWINKATIRGLERSVRVRIHVRKSQIQGLFKDMYQQIQGLNTEKKALEISKIWRWIVQNATLMSPNSFLRYEHAKSIQQNVRFWVSNNFRKYPKTKARKILRTFKYFFTNSRPWIFVFKFKDIQGLSSFVRTLVCASEGIANDKKALGW
jgi:hypothetical protein